MSAAPEKPEPQLDAGEPPPETPRRRHGRIRRFVLRPFLWLLALLALGLCGLYLYLGSAAFHERAKGFLVARLSEATGRKVSAGAVDLQLFPLGIEVKELVIPGTTPEERPLARLPFLRVEASLSGFAHPKLELGRIWLKGPELYLEVRPDGSTNLPALPAGSSGKRSLEVELGSLLVEQGRFGLNELEIPLSLEARQAELSLEGAPKGSFEGQLQVGEVELTLPDAKPYTMALSAELAAGPQGVEIRRARVAGKSLALEAAGGYHLAAGGDQLALSFKATADAEVLTELGYTHGEVSGPLEATGRFGWQQGTWSLEAQSTSPALASKPWALEQVSFRTHGGPKELRFDLDSARFDGAPVTGNVRLDFEDQPLQVAVALDAEEVPVATIFSNLGLEAIGLGGRAKGRAAYRFLPAEPFAGDGEATLEVASDPRGSEPIQVSGPVSLRVAQGLLLGDSIDVSSPGQAITVSGLHVRLEDGLGGLAVRVASQDLGPLAALVPIDRSQGAPPWLPTTGQGTLAATLGFGSPAGVRAALDLELAPASGPGFTADAAHGHVEISERAVESLAVVLERGGGRAQVEGRVPFAAQEALDLTVHAQAWPLAEVRALLPLELPLDGPATAEIHLGGTTAALTGQVKASVAPAEVAGLKARRASVELDFDPSRAQISRASLQFPAGEVHGQGKVGLGKGDPIDLSLEAPALTLAAAPFSDVLGESLSGSLALSGHLAGTLERPQGELSTRVSGARLGELELAPSELQGRWDGERLELAGSLLSLVAVEGGGPFSLERTELAVKLRSERLAELVAFSGAAAPSGFAGSFAGVLSVSGALQDARVALTLDTLNVSYLGHHLANLEPVRAELVPDGLALRSLYLGEPGEEAEFFLGGKIGFATGTPLGLQVQATLPAAWASPWLGGLQATGTLNALATIHGPLAEPEVNGQADVVGAEVVIPDFPHSFTETYALALIYPDELVLDTLDARFAGGRVRGSGTVKLPSGDYRFQATALDLHLRYPDGWVIDGNADLSLSPTPSGQEVRGSLQLARAAYLRDLKLNLFELLGGFLRRKRVEMGVADPLYANTQLNVVVNGPGALVVDNNLANLRATTDLVVRGTLARPVLVGRVEALPGGTLVYGETEYQVDRGLLTFASLERIDPVVDLVATAEVRDYDVRLALTGTLDRLNASFSSDPPLPDLDVLSLLATGGSFEQTAQAAAAGSNGQPVASNAGASQFLAGQAASAITSRVKGLFGFDKLRIDPISSASGELNAARIIVGKQITRDLFVTYQRDAAAQANDLVEAEWRVGKTLLVVFSIKDGEQYAMDLRWETRY